MPKSTHQHLKKDTANTDKKFRPDDERLYAREKREFQESEQQKKAGDELRRDTEDQEEKSSNVPDESRKK